MYHVTPAVGWMNDPNGFSVYQGDYHLFYQYYPYDVKWEPMHWGHYKTHDFSHWEMLPAAPLNWRMEIICLCIPLIWSSP